MIPDEAVVAAAEEIHDVRYGVLNRTWDECPDDIQFQCRIVARAALEAAAPHMLAEAWGQGHESGFWNGRLSQLTVPYDAPEPEIGVEHAKSHDPYRSQS